MIKEQIWKTRNKKIEHEVIQEFRRMESKIVSKIPASDMRKYMRSSVILSFSGQQMKLNLNPCAIQMIGNPYLLDNLMQISNSKLLIIQKE